MDTQNGFNCFKTDWRVPALVREIPLRSWENSVSYRRHFPFSSGKCFDRWYAPQTARADWLVSRTSKPLTVNKPECDQAHTRCKRPWRSSHSTTSSILYKPTTWIVNLFVQSSTTKGVYTYHSEFIRRKAKFNQRFKTSYFKKSSQKST